MDIDKCANIEIMESNNDPEIELTDDYEDNENDASDNNSQDKMNSQESTNDSGNTNEPSLPLNLSQGYTNGQTKSGERNKRSLASCGYSVESILGHRFGRSSEKTASAEIRSNIIGEFICEFLQSRKNH